MRKPKKKNYEKEKRARRNNPGVILCHGPGNERTGAERIDI